MAKKTKKKTAKKTTKKAVKSYLMITKNDDGLVVEGENLSQADVYAIGKILMEASITQDFQKLSNQN